MDLGIGVPGYASSSQEHDLLKLFFSDFSGDFAGILFRTLIDQY